MNAGIWPLLVGFGLIGYGLYRWRTMTVGDTAVGASLVTLTGCGIALAGLVILVVA